MDVNHVDGESEKKRQVQSIFSIFSNLFSENGVKGKAFVNLLSTLNDVDVSPGSGSNVKYTLKRFVRGLSSGQLYPQCASFAGLSSLLKYDLTTVDEVLDILDAESKGNFSRSEQGALNSGCVLTCGAIIHSGVFNDMSAETKEKMLVKLVKTGRTKSYLCAVTSKFLVDLVCNVTEEDFKSLVWPVCRKEIKPTEDNTSAHNYDFLLVCHNKFPSIVETFLKKSELSYESFIEKFVMTLVNGSAILDDNIYERLCVALLENKKLLLRLWTDIINNVSNSKSSFKEKTVLILFYFILKNLKEEKLVPKLLVPKFIDMIIMILSFRKSKKVDDSDCHAAAKASLDLLVNCLIKEGVVNSIRFKTIQKLMFYPANMKFEKKTGTKCIQTLIMHLNSNCLKELADMHKDIISGNLKKVVDEEGNEEDWNNNEKQYVLHIFVRFLNHPSVKSEKEWKLSQIQFLFDTGFLKNHKIHSSVQKCARDCFYKSIEVQMSSLEDVLELLDEMLVYVNDKIETNAVNLSENATKSWNKVFSTIQTLRESKEKLFVAIHMFLLHMGLQLFSDTNLAIFNIDELLQCYERLKGRKKNKTDKGEQLHWSEVTVDLMLSLLSRENKLWRYVVCDLVFPQMVKHITPSALHQIIDVLNTQSSKKILNDSQQSDLSEDDEDEDEEEEEDADEEDKEGEKSESSLTESDCDETITLNDQLRSAVKDALGMSAALTDQESVDMDDMDEEEERKLNERLAAAFKMFKSNTGKQNKKQTKEEKALTHFRFRILDLVEIYVTSGPSMAGCLDLLHPLFGLLELSIKDPNQRVLHNRVDSILKKLSSLKKVTEFENISEKLIADHFEILLNRKEVPSMVFVEMAPRISDCCTFLVRCSQMITRSETEIPLVSNYNSLLDNFFHSRDNKLPIALFQSVLRSSWRGNWMLVSTLFDVLADPSVKLFKKMKAVELLDIFYKNGKLHASGDDKTKIQLTQTENKFIKKFMEYQTEYQNKKIKTNEKMFLAFFARVISLVATANQCFKRSRADGKKAPRWENLITKMTEMDVLLTNKKSRRGLANLAGLFDLKLPEVPTPGDETRGTLSGSSAQEEETSNAEEKEAEEAPRKKRKSKPLSADKVKLKKESSKLREAMGSDGIDMVPFSSLDVYAMSQDDDVEEPPGPKPKKRKVRLNGDAS